MPGGVSELVKWRGSSLGGLDLRLGPSTDRRVHMGWTPC